MGWGAVISASLFTLGHVLSFDKDFHITFAPQVLSWLDLIIFSFGMTWLRYKYNSVWPPVVAHNVGNTFEVLTTSLPFFR